MMISQLKNKPIHERFYGGGEGAGGRGLQTFTVHLNRPVLSIKTALYCMVRCGTPPPVGIVATPLPPLPHLASARTGPEPIQQNIPYLSS